MPAALIPRRNVTEPLVRPTRLTPEALCRRRRLVAPHTPVAFRLGPRQRGADALRDLAVQGYGTRGAPPDIERGGAGPRSRSEPLGRVRDLAGIGSRVMS